MKDFVDVLHSKMIFWKVSPRRLYLSTNILDVPLHQTAVRSVRQDNLKFQLVFCSALWRCSELLLPCLGALADVLWQTLIVGGGHITVSSNVWKSRLAAPAWGVY